jgi:Flp pilus assembly protein protease CpaA
MNFELLRVAIAVVGTGALAWEDWRTSFMDDRVLYAMIFAGAILDLATLDASFVFSAFAPFTLILFGGYFLWRAGQFGAGDVYLFAGLQLLLPFAPFGGQQLVPFALSVFLAASLFAVIGTAAGYAVMLRGKLRGVKAFVLAALLFAGLGVFAFYGASLVVAVLYLLFASSFFYLLYRNEIIEANVEMVPLRKVDEEDVLALDRLPKSKVKEFGLEKVATRKQLKRLKKTGLKKFPVYKHLPRFGPFVLAGLLACLALGDVYLFLSGFN